MVGFEGFPSKSVNFTGFEVFPAQFRKWGFGGGEYGSVEKGNVINCVGFHNNLLDHLCVFLFSFFLFSFLDNCKIYFYFIFQI